MNNRAAWYWLCAIVLSTCALTAAGIQAERTALKKPTLSVSAALAGKLGR